MIEPNTWHPYPRYGLAASLVSTQRNSIDFSDKEEVRKILLEALKAGMGQFMIMRKEVPAPDFVGKLAYTFLQDETKVNPGSKSGQNAPNGYYVAPHVLTANNAAGLVKEIKALSKIIDSEKFDYSASIELKRSFAPLVAKLNNGKTSMSNPKVGALLAACTALATLTPLKAATYTDIKGGGDAYNVGVIVDLPFYDEKNQDFPLSNFIRLLQDLMAQRSGSTQLVGRYEKKYFRPAIFQGNYPNAPRNSSLGATSLLVAIGEWIKEAQEFSMDESGEFASRVLYTMVGQPLYLVSNAGTRQETFGHHLVGLTVKGEIKQIVQGIFRTRLMGEQVNEKGESPKTKQFRMMADRFLRLFSPASFRDFLAFRAEYPFELGSLITLYMKQQPNLTPELISSARAYGESLNYAAYIASKNEVANNKERKQKGLNQFEYKDKMLSQFESTVRSAKTGTALLSQMSTIAGRITKREIGSEAIPFMEAVALGDQAGGIQLETAKELMTAFMRVSTYVPKTETASSDLQALETTSDEDTPE